MIYFEFMKEIMLWTDVIREDFRRGVATDLNFSEAMLIWFVYNSSGRAYELAEILGKDSGQLYRELKKLEEKGVIEKDSAKKNIEYILTKEGRVVIENIKISTQKYIDLHPEECKRAEKVIEELKDLRGIFSETLNIKKKRGVIPSLFFYI